MTNNSVPPNSIWPNSDGNLGKVKAQIPDGITTRWPDGDALVNDFVYKDGKLVGFVDSRALVINDEKTSTIPYDYAKLSLPSIFKGTMSFQSGERNKTLIDDCEEDAGIFVAPLLKELLGNVEFKAEHIKSENKLVVHTDRLDDEQLAAVTDMLKRFVPGFIEVVQYNHHIEISWKTMYKYRDCKNVRDIQAVNATWYKELVIGVRGTNSNPYANYGWYYFPNFIGGGYLWDSGSIKTHSFAPYNIYIHLPALETLTSALANDGAGEIYTKTIHAYVPNLKTVTGRFFSNQHLEVLDCELPMLEDAPQFSIFQKINKESAIKMLDSLPAYTSGTHRFRLGISKGVVGDEDVIAAASRAEEKGWSLTIEYRTPSGDYEPLTYGLRGDTIYAKIRNVGKGI